jgi:hypothetical protein
LYLGLLLQSPDRGRRLPSRRCPEALCNPPTHQQRRSRSRQRCRPMTGKTRGPAQQDRCAGPRFGAGRFRPQPRCSRAT